MFYSLICFMIVLTGVLCLAYVGMIAFFCLGWKKTKVPSIAAFPDTRVAVIIAARNEEKTIGACINSIIGQTYPASCFELIIVNDNSTDATEKIILTYLNEHPNIRLINLSDHLKEGKKNAISIAIKLTNAELIITTDADCEMGENWIGSIVSCYSITKAKMIVGPVSFHHESGVFEKMQSLEMLALMGSTCGSLFYEKAIMCNGANLAYTKEVFEEINGFEGINKKPTGDDVLLMYKINGKYKGHIKFLKERNAIVYTKAKAKFSDFLEQRKRWASKDLRSLNAETKVVSFLVYLTNLMILLMGVITGFASIKSSVYLSFFEICLILLGIKCLIDFLLLFLAASFFRKEKLLYLFLPEQFIYLLYVAVVGILGNKAKYTWKGRKY